MTVNLTVGNDLSASTVTIDISASGSASNSAIGAVANDLFSFSSSNKDVVAIQQQTNAIVTEYNNKTKETAKKEAVKLEERQKEEAKLRDKAEAECSEGLKNTERENWIENYVSKGMDKMNTISQIGTAPTANTTPDATFGSLTGGQTMKLVSVVQRTADTKNN